MDIFSKFYWLIYLTATIGPSFLVNFFLSIIALALMFQIFFFFNLEIDSSTLWIFALNELIPTLDPGPLSSKLPGQNTRLACHLVLIIRLNFPFYVFMQMHKDKRSFNSASY